MMTKIYFTLWAVYLTAAATLYLTGNATPRLVVALGFISFGMVFMGIMGVLPTSVHEAHNRH